MKKKILFLLVIICSIFTLSACTNKNSDAAKFKEEYETLNGEKTSYSDEKYREVTISNDNPYIYSDAQEILDLIDEKETFYVYFGSSYCPWCRSVIEKSIEIAKENNIDKIYYVDIWDGFHNEILRDTYEINDDGVAEKVKDGTDEYYKLLKKLDSVLEKYTITDESDNDVDIGEKRIFAPDFIYIEKGVPKKITTGISTKQKESGSKLTKKILKDEEKAFNDFFNN